MKNQKFNRRLGYALNGITEALKKEKSFKSHLIAAASVYGVLLYLSPPLIWWAVITLLVVGILAAELLNSAIELLCDFVQPNHSEVIKLIKDLAAGAVLLLSVGAIAIAIFLLIDVGMN